MSIDALQIARLMMCGAMLYIAVYELWLHRMRTEDASHGVAGLWTLNAAIFVATRVAQNSEISDAWIRHAIGLQITTGLLALPLGLHIARVISNAPFSATLRWIVRMSALSALLPWLEVAWREPPLIWREDVLGNAYRTLGPSLAIGVAAAWVVVGSLAFVRVLHRSRPETRLDAELYRERRRVALLAVTLLAPAGLNDILLARGSIQTIQVLDWAFGLLVLGLAYLLARRSVVFFGMLEALVDTRTQELQRRQAQLVAADRLASLGTLAAGVAHEINNPLTYIGANLEAIEQHVRVARRQHDEAWLKETRGLAREARDGARAVRDIVEQLRVFARTERHEHRPIDVRASLRTAIAMTRNRIHHRADLLVEMQQVPYVLGHAGELTQVLLNLLTNASDAIPESTRGEIRVRTYGEADGSCRISITDTGNGIAPAALERMFDPFFTTKSVREGTGLGLSICHGIVTGLGGAIEAESQIGTGTTMTVVLPGTGELTPEALAEAQRSSAPPPLEEPRHRVLLVDDDRLVARAIRRMLRDHDVVVVSGGAEAIELALNEPFDAILCDLMMPGVGGIDVYEALATTKPEAAARFAFVTGGSFTPRADAFLANETVPLLRKPLESEELRALVRRLAAGRESKQTA